MLKQYSIFCCLLFACLSAPIFAEKITPQDGDIKQMHRSLQRTSLTRTSPFDPPTEHTFFTDAGAGLDTGCTFNDYFDHPLVIEIIIDKAVGPVDANGYLINANSLIAQGVIPSTVSVVMPAFDVDVNGGPPPERNEVILNGNFLGTLTGDHQIWSLNNFSIDVRQLKFPAPGSDKGAINTVQINVDTLASGRWCTAIDWVALNIKIKPAVALTLTPSKNNPVWADSSTQIKKIYEQAIDANCALIEDTSAPAKKPFSGAGGSGGAFVDIKTELAACGSGTLTDAEVEVSWRIQGTNKQGNTSWTGDTGKVSLSLPAEIGAYSVNFDYQVNGNSLPTITRTLYVTKAAPTISKPLAVWYEKATDWARGQTSDANILKNVLQGLYTFGENNWEYGYNFGPVTKCNWKDLLSNPITCNYADCYVFSNVFENMSGLLGIGGMTSVVKIGAIARGLFVTKAEPSLDPAFPGNAKPIGGNYDRYLFSNHSLRLRGGLYYDATFNGIYSTDTEFIAWNLDGHSETDAHGDYRTTLEGAKIYTYVPASPNKYEISWRANEYIAPVQLAPPQTRSLALSGEDSSNLTKTIAASAVFAPADEEGDSRFDKFKATLDIEFPHAGFYNIQTVLTKNGEVIANRSAHEDSRPSEQLFNAPSAGIYPVELEFSGQQILESAEDGPYTLSARVFSFGGGNFEVTATSPAYEHTEFGELDATLTSLREEAIDTDADTLFDILQVDAVVSVNVAGQYVLKATLLGATKTIENIVSSVTLVKGTTALPLQFSGIAIHRAENNGPYKIAVSLSNDEDETINTVTLQSRGYHYDEFEAIIDLLGTMQSEGVDINNNGLFEQLRITVPIEVRRVGEYILDAALTDESGDKSSHYSSNVQLNASTSELSFVFEGGLIKDLQMNGPYTLSFNLKELSGDIDISDSIVVSQPTPHYSFDDFESADEKSDITLTGNNSDMGVDTDNNGLYNQLLVNLGIDITVGGSYSWSATLVDVNYNQLELASGSTVFQRGANFLSMPFNGQLIGENGVAGPYLVTNLAIFSDNGANLVVIEAIPTHAYQANQFEGYVAATLGDFDADGDVDKDDLSLLIPHLNQAVNTTNSTMDLDGDGFINIVDFRRLRLLCSRPNCAI